jgi:hypothetical protein
MIEKGSNVWQDFKPSWDDDRGAIFNGIRFDQNIVRSLFTYKYPNRKTTWTFEVLRTNFQHSADFRDIEIWREEDGRKLRFRNITSCRFETFFVIINADEATVVQASNGVQAMMDAIEDV